MEEEKHKPCIFSSQGAHPFRYDICRSCPGHTEGCLNYLSEFRHSKPLDDTQQGRTTSNPNYALPRHNDSSPAEAILSYDPIMARHGRFNFWQHQHSIQEPLLPRADFLQRFRRYQR